MDMFNHAKCMYDIDEPHHVVYCQLILKLHVQAVVVMSDHSLSIHRAKRRCIKSPQNTK